MKIYKILVLAISAIGLTATVNAEELSGTLAKVKETGTLTLGVRDSNVPFSYMDDDQNHIGYSVDLCGKVTESVKKKLDMPDLKVKTVPVTSSTRIPLVLNGTIDLTCAAAAITPDREKQVVFAKAIFVAQPSLAVKKSSNIKSIHDLKGKSIVGNSGSSDIIQIHEQNDEYNLGMKVQEAPDQMNAFMMMASDRAMAYENGNVLLAGLIAASKNPDDFEVVPLDNLPVEPWSIMMRPNDPDFKQLVDDTLVEVYGSGEIKDIYKKWFESPIPPHGYNLNMPIEQQLKIFENPTDSSDPEAYK